MQSAIRSQGTSRLARVGQIAVAVPVLLLLLPLVVLVLGIYFLYGLALQVLIWSCWCTRGTRVLLVYSDSPVWHDYLEREVIPRLPQRTVVLNWSERRQWASWSLAVWAFRYFGGHREYNPLAVVFRPFRWARTFRLYEPFRDFKHGKTASLQQAVHDLFRCV